MTSEKRTVYGRSGATALVMLCLSSCGGGAPASPPGASGGEPGEQLVTGVERLGWTQEAGSGRELTALRHWVYVDGVREALDGTRCPDQQSAGIYACSAPLPQMTLGRHVLELTATLTRDSQTLESARSRPLVVVVTGGAQTNEAEADDIIEWIGGEEQRAADHRPYVYETIARGLNVAIAVAAMPDGSVLVGERRGTLKLVGTDYPPNWIALDDRDLREVKSSEIVLHGLVLHPDFHRTALVYLMYTEGATGNAPVTRVARFRQAGGRLGERAILLDGIPARPVNPSGALAFGPDEELYVTTDDGGLSAGPSDAGVLAGKVIRLNEDGGAVARGRLPSAVIFGGLHRPTGLGWLEGTDQPWLVDEAPPASALNPSRQQAVSVHVFADVSSACVYRGTRFPLLTNKVVVAEGESLRYIHGATAEPYGSQFLLNPDVGQIQVVQTDEEGFLYVGTGNTGPNEEVGRDVLIRISLRSRGAHYSTSSPLPPP